MAAADDLSLGCDPATLRERYAQERNKRLRPEGKDQYVSASGRFSHYADDPFVAPGFTRAPLNVPVEVLIVGGGFGGLLAAARLREAGVEDIRIVEKAGDFGGTWYWNRYPGAQCDIESYIYLPLLEETGYIPTKKYVDAPEILAHAVRIGERYDLYRGACFQTQVTEIRWIEEESRWLVSTNRSDQLKARFIVLCSGPLDRPKLPGIPGIDGFKGHIFHTSRWDYGYSGGDNTGKLDGLSDKRVAVIGTGATGIQCVPYLSKSARHLYVFQRTPSGVEPRGNRPTDPEWVKTLTPGWQSRRMQNFSAWVQGGHEEIDLVDDCWTSIARDLGPFGPSAGAPAGSPEDAEQAAERLDFMHMNAVRARVDACVTDRRTAEALKPWFRTMCKRPTFNDDYLPAFNLPNVTLVDTQGRGVERITEDGIVANGEAYALDCIIFATGFEVGTALQDRTGFEVYGRGGKPLGDHWKGGLKTLHGCFSRGFPNCFFMGVSQNALIVNFTHVVAEQAAHIAAVVRQLRLQHIRWFDLSEAAQAEWVTSIRNNVGANAKFLRECTPGYYNNEGKEDDAPTPMAELYGGGFTQFNAILRAWRDAGLQGLELHT